MNNKVLQVIFYELASNIRLLAYEYAGKMCIQVIDWSEAFNVNLTENKLVTKISCEKRFKYVLRNI